MLFFPFAIAFWALLGCLFHFLRGVVAIFPERPTGDPWLDSRAWGGFSMTDQVFGTEFDEDGYYELYSWQNLKVSIMSGIVVGLIMMIAVPDFTGALADMLINQFHRRLGMSW